MREQLRRRRREGAGEGSQHAEPAAQLIALQHAVGNRALQRLVWDAYTGTTYVPQAYLDQTVPFNLDKDELRADDAKPQKGKDPSLHQILEHNPARLEAVARGFNVGFVTKLIAETDNQLEARGRLAAATQDAELLRKLAAAGKSRNQIVLHNPEELATTADVAKKTPFILRPTEYFSQAPDLPAVGTKLRETKVPKKGKLTYYHYTCVLIALVKDNGMAKAKALAKTIGTDEAALVDTPSAVYALHDYYMTNNVQYDDSSTRFQVMAEWGYNMVFSGESNWLALGKEIELQPGGYVFDIPGHTLKVTVKKKVGKDMPAKATFNEYFKAESDSENYGLGDEHTKPVRYVWKK
jgi:hypothetical protein